MKQIPRFTPPFTSGDIFKALIGAGYSGDELNTFADRFAEYINVAHAVHAPSAREALAGVLQSLDLREGGEVIMPSLTFHSVPEMLLRFGLRPRFVDIELDTYCIDPNRLEDAVNSSTVAILPVHLYGRASDMEAVQHIAGRHGLVVIEDCAQGCGGRFRGRRLGSFGDAAFFSFYPSKNLSAFWAGMVTTDSRGLATGVAEHMDRMPVLGRTALARRCMTSLSMNVVTHPIVWNVLAAPALRLGSLFGVDPIERAVDESPGKAGSINDEARCMPRPMQGRFALGQLDGLDKANDLRIRNGERLRERLEDIPGIEVPRPAPRGENIYLTFVARVRDREDFRRRLLRLGIDTHAGNMDVGPRLPGLEGSGEGEIAAEAISHMVHLPVSPRLSVSDVDRVADAVIRILSERADGDGKAVT